MIRGRHSVVFATLAALGMVGAAGAIAQPTVDKRPAPIVAGTARGKAQRKKKRNGKHRRSTHAMLAPRAWDRASFERAASRGYSVDRLGNLANPLRRQKKAARKRFPTLASGRAWVRYRRAMAWFDRQQEGAHA